MNQEYQDTLFLIKQINDKFEAKGNANCKKAELTLSQFRFLMYLIDHKDSIVTQREMEKIFKISHPAVNGILKRLEEKQFISTKLTKESKTQKIINLEKKGFEAVMLIKEDRNTTDIQLEQIFDENDWNELRRLLMKIIEVL